jgi:multiple sugar transport system substrate-binding protein
MIQTLIREGVMPTPESIKAMPYEQMFLSGRLGILLLGQWGVITYTSEDDLKTGIAPVPRGVAGSKTTLFIDEFVSFKNAAHPEESWRALKFFIGKEGTGIMAERNTLGVPAYKPVAEGMRDKIYSGLTRPEVASVFQSLDFAEAFPFTVEYLQMIQAHNVQIDLIGLDKISAEEGVKKIHAEWTNIMNQP